MTQPSTLLMPAISCYHVSIITGAARTRLIRNLSQIISCSAASLGSALPILIYLFCVTGDSVANNPLMKGKGLSATADFE